MITYEDIIEIFKRLAGPLKMAVMMIIGRCVLLATQDEKGIQTINASVLAGEILTNIERFHDYGFTGHAPANSSEGVIVFPMGNRENGICIKMDNREFRLKNLAQGEVALYTDEGDTIEMRRENNIIVNCSNKVTVNATNEIEMNTDIMKVNAATSILFKTQYFEVEAPESRIKTGNLTVDQLTTTGNLSVLGNYGSGGAQVRGDITIIPSIGNGDGTINTQQGDIITQTGDVTDKDGSSLDVLRQTYNSHTHQQNTSGETDPPNQQDS